MTYPFEGSKVKVESAKVGLKLNIQKTKIMASGPITSWEIDGETVETVSDFFWGGSKITFVRAFCSSSEQASSFSSLSSDMIGVLDCF